MNISHIEILKNYILTKSWWDTIDHLDKIVGDIALRDKKVNEILLNWSLDENIWIRRVAINHQILRKEKTNIELLEQIIINNFNQKEFFIRHKNSMNNLSIREASKYIL